jgi:hypothetical protein
MADNDGQRRNGSAERRLTEARKHAETERAALDNAEVPDEPSEIRNGL